MGVLEKVRPDIDKNRPTAPTAEAKSRAFTSEA